MVRIDVERAAERRARGALVAEAKLRGAARGEGEGIVRGELGGAREVLQRRGAILSLERVFAAQMENFIAAGDVAFGISGSGNSASVLRALELAREKGATTVGLVGSGGGKMNALLDCAIVVPSDHMQKIEDAHLILAHLIFLDFKSRIEAAIRLRSWR